MEEKRITLYGSIKDLELININSTGNVYKLRCYIKYKGDILYFSNECCFNGYTKKEIFQRLKDGILQDLNNRIKEGYKIV
jgi:hypothetical protein